jgi:hypothetical protein
MNQYGIFIFATPSAIHREFVAHIKLARMFSYEVDKGRRGMGLKEAKDKLDLLKVTVKGKGCYIGPLVAHQGEQGKAELKRAVRAVLDRITSPDTDSVLRILPALTQVRKLT